MTEVRRTIHASPDAVWEALADPTTYPEWLLGAQAIRSVDPGFPAPGTSFHHKVGATRAVTIDDSTTAVEADPPSTLVLKVHARPFFEGIVRYRLVPTRAGTELVLAEEPAGRFRRLAPLLRPFVFGRNARSIDKLAHFVESRAAANGAGKR